MEGYIAPYNEYYMVILSQHTELTYMKHCASFLPVNHCTALQVANIVPGCLPCQHDQLSRQQGSAAFCHLHGQVGVVANQAMTSAYIFSFSSDGAPPGANGHPVPITYEGFTLLTDNYNNYFMSSFIPQVPLNKERQSPKTCSPVQLLPAPRLPNKPLPASANF